MQDDKERITALLVGLGKTIREVRLERGLGQAQVGESGNMSRLETGQQWVSADVLVQIAETLDIPIWALFAKAEGAVEGPLWAILDAYQTANPHGRELIEHAAQLAKNLYTNNHQAPNMRRSVTAPTVPRLRTKKAKLTK